MRVGRLSETRNLPHSLPLRYSDNQHYPIRIDRRTRPKKSSGCRASVSGTRVEMAPTQVLGYTLAMEIEKRTND